MKLSIVVSTQPASFSALAYQGALEENLSKVKSLGYDGVELAIRNPDELCIEELIHSLQMLSLPVSAIGTGQAFGEEGLSFAHPEKKIREKAIGRIIAQMELAEKLKTLVILGLIRGREVGDIGQEQTLAWFADGIKECAAYYPSVKLAIEPINRYECEILNTVDSSLRFLNKIKADNVGLLLDTFHMNIEEPSIFDSIIAAKDVLFHFHVADSNRWYPGAGHIDFNCIVDTLHKINYTGYLSAEIMPIPDPDTAALKTIETMNTIRIKR